MPVNICSCVLRCSVLNCTVGLCCVFWHVSSRSSEAEHADLGCKNELNPHASETVQRLAENGVGELQKNKLKRSSQEKTYVPSDTSSQ